MSDEDNAALNMSTDVKLRQKLQNYFKKEDLSTSNVSKRRDSTKQKT